jgi:NO-binding membrane sensor protein with MHYT domain
MQENVEDINKLSNFFPNPQMNLELYKCHDKPKKIPTQSPIVFAICCALHIVSHTFSLKHTHCTTLNTKKLVMFLPIASSHYTWFATMKATFNFKPKLLTKEKKRIYTQNMTT